MTIKIAVEVPDLQTLRLLSRTYLGVPPIPIPGRVSLVDKRSTGMSQFGVKFTFPAPANPADVVSRKLLVNGGTLPDEERTYPGTATVSDEWVFDENANVTATLRDSDAAGNLSLPSAPFTVLINDDIPPVAPGNLGVTDKRQI